MEVWSCKRTTRTLPFTVLIALFIRSLDLVHKVCRFIFIAFVSISRYFLNALVVNIRAASIVKVIHTISTSNKVEWNKRNLSLFRLHIEGEQQKPE